MKNYKITWRLKIKAIDELPKNSKKYIMSKWGRFMGVIMSKDKTPTQCADLCEIRKTVLDANFNIENIYEDMMNNDSELFRLFADISHLFDHLPTDLRAYILLSFGFNSYDLKEIIKKTT